MATTADNSTSRNSRQFSFFDRMIGHADLALKTVVPNSVHADRVSPAESEQEAELDDEQRAHIAGLMRINHTGEVCAQALYQGQSVTAKLPEVREAMEHAALEEVDHLAWCENRVHELGSHTSYFNPLWYGLSFAIGAVAGIVGDKWSLGFVAETEKQVCKHLDEHMEQLPAKDRRSMEILKQMHEDEEKHGTVALEAGGAELPPPVKTLMTLMSKVMTKTTYRW